MPLSLQGKSVLITGSSRGIGRSIGEAFLAEGSQVAFNGRNLSDLELVVASHSDGKAIAIC